MSLEELFHQIVENEMEKCDDDIKNKDDKLREIKKLYEGSKLKFIITFSSYISPSQFELFYHKSDGSKEDDSYVMRMKVAYEKAKKNNGVNVSVRNDRWMMYEELSTTTDFFSDKKMRERDPQLYDTMIGKYLNDVEKEGLKPNPINSGFSGVMQQFNDSERISQRKVRCSNIKELYEEVVINGNVSLLEEDDRIPQEEDNNDSDKEFLRNEFLNIMKQRFINGEDTEFFDYNSYKIKGNKKINRIKEQDLEDSYFEED
uniref:DUF2052 domain-containing protein n=1 Tax=Strongyloides papillosus TaxID=174720 RepID=A0A0N5BGH7_STREA